MGKKPFFALRGLGFVANHGGVKNAALSKSGQVNRIWLIVLGVMMAGAALVVLVRPSLLLRPIRSVQARLAGTSHKSQPIALSVRCASSLQQVMERAEVEYEKQTGQPIDVTYGPSQTLLVQLAETKKGDLFIPADDGYLGWARGNGLVKESYPLTHMGIRLAVKKGNPKKLISLASLKDNNVRLSQTDPNASAMGKLVCLAASRTGDWIALTKQTTAWKTTVAEVASDVQMGLADAGFVWDVMAAQYPDLDFVALPETGSSVAHVAMGVCAHSGMPHEAAKFAQWLADPQQGFKLWQAAGYPAR